MAVARRLAVVAEDKLTEAILHKCISAFLPAFTIIRTEVKNGRGNVQRELQAYARLAKAMPVIVGVDLDGDKCAPALLNVWQESFDASDNLVIRVAVREVESWVLADRKRVANFINAASDDITKTPDELADPKKALLDLVRQCADDDLKRDLIPKNYNKYPRIGPAYNLRMCGFVREKWRPHVARNRSDSLARAIAALEVLMGR